MKRKFRKKRKAPDGYMTTAAAAEYLGVSIKTIRRYISCYDLPATKPGGLWIIKKGDLIEWAEKNG